MGFFDFFRQADINKGVADYRSEAGAVLIDVRSAQEYAQGHIPGSTNVPLDRLDAVGAVAGDRNIPLFVYCYSGARSSQAAGTLQRMGYSNVNNIGGIAAYSGRLEQ